MVQKRGGQPIFEAQISRRARQSRGTSQQLMTVRQPPAAPAPAGALACRRRGPASEKLADGVFRIRGAYNALAVEFADHIVLFEPGPQNEARAQAIIAETKTRDPEQADPLRRDLASSFRSHRAVWPAVVAEGITIVTPAVNKAFLETALSAPRTLAPDSLSKSGKKPVVEGFTGRQARVPGRHADIRDPRDQGPAARRRPCGRLSAEGEESWSMRTCSTCRRRTIRFRILRSSARVFRGQHRPPEAGCRADHVGPLAESRSAHLGRGHQGVAGQKVAARCIRIAFPKG